MRTRVIQSQEDSLTCIMALIDSLGTASEWNCNMLPYYVTMECILLSVFFLHNLTNMVI